MRDVGENSATLNFFTINWNTLSAEFSHIKLVFRFHFVISIFIFSFIITISRCMYNVLVIILLPVFFLYGFVITTSSCWQILFISIRQSFAPILSPLPLNKFTASLKARKKLKVSHIKLKIVFKFLKIFWRNIFYLEKFSKFHTSLFGKLLFLITQNFSKLKHRNSLKARIQSLL